VDTRWAWVRVQFLARLAWWVWIFVEVSGTISGRVLLYPNKTRPAAIPSSRPPGLSQSTRSPRPSARHHQSRTCRVRARLPSLYRPDRRVLARRRRPKPLHSRIRLGRNRSAGLVRIPRTSRPGGGRAARFLCGCAGKARRRGGCGSPLALCGVQTSATGGGGGDIRFGHAVPRTLPLVRCLTARRKEPGRQAGGGWPLGLAA
jgi:hypothetical protein